MSVVGREKGSALTLCTDFSWDRVCFLLSRWYSALFWIQYENNVDATLKFWLLLSDIPKSMTFLFPLLFEWADAQESWREHSQDSWPELTRGMFHTTECHVTHINWQHLLRTGSYRGSGTGLVSISVWWTIVLCITCYSCVFCLFFLLSFLYYYFMGAFLQLLHCSYLTSWVYWGFPADSAPCPIWGGREWMAA